MRTQRRLLLSLLAAVAVGLTAVAPASAAPVSTSARAASVVEAPSGLAQIVCKPVSSRYYFGTSSVHSYHQTDCLRYTGTAYATGGVYKGERVIQTCFTYTRGGKTLMKKCANSAFVNGKWTTGKVEGTILDDLRDGDQYRTHFYYSYKTVPIGVV